VTVAREPAWQRVARLGLVVRWTTLREGLCGVGADRSGLTPGDVSAWAQARLDDPGFDPPAELFALVAIPTTTGSDRDSLAAVIPVVEQLAAAERAEAAIEARKWRLAELVALVDRVETWEPTSDTECDDRSCQMWSWVRELWEAWAPVERPAFFFRPDGNLVSCYCGRDLYRVVGDYRAWIEAERAVLLAADRDAAG
jgi:hypothetical protein